MQDWKDTDMPLAVFNEHCEVMRQVEQACKNLYELSSMTQLYYYNQEMERAISVVKDLTEKFLKLRREFYGEHKS